MSGVALVTASVVDEDIDLVPLLDALRSEGIEAESPCWDDDAVDWGAFDLAVLRSTWDYVDRYDEFVTWLTVTSERVRVLNPPSVLLWNMDKRYLADLRDDHSLAIIPTTFYGADDAPLIEACNGDVVVKPVRGAGSSDALRHQSVEDAQAHLAQLLGQGRSAMVQPYMTGIETHGETGLVYFGGEFSHAFRKSAILTTAGVSPVDGLYAPEVIDARTPSAAERDLADRAVQACKEDLLYARVDLVPDDHGAPVIIELELTEPSYFVEHSPGAAARFARAVAVQVAESPGGTT